MLADCGLHQYAVRDEHSEIHGLPMRKLQLVFNAKILTKILYVSPARWRLMGREELLRIELFLRRAKKLGFYHILVVKCLRNCAPLRIMNRLKKFRPIIIMYLHQFLPEKNGQLQSS